MILRFAGSVKDFKVILEMLGKIEHLTLGELKERKQK